MKFPVAFAALSVLSLAASGAFAQTGQPGAGDQVTPASATPQTHTRPNLRTDSQPHTSLDQATDSAPLPETLGMDATPLMDRGRDFSIPVDESQTTETTLIKTHKGQVSVTHVQTHPAVAGPVTNPPDPPTRVMENVPQPPLKQMPPPQDPLSAEPQPSSSQ